MISYYNRDGRPIRLMTWAKLLENLKYRVVAQDHYKDYTVSTIWLGLDHNFTGGPPHIFETVVFYAPNLDRETVEIRRYSTEAEALEGHRQLLELVHLLEFTQTGETDGNE